MSTPAEAVVSYRAECERSEHILTGFALDNPLTVQPAELVGEVTTVRGALLT